MWKEEINGLDGFKYDGEYLRTAGNEGKTRGIGRREFMESRGGRTHLASL